MDLLFVTGQYLRPDIVVVPAGARAGITDRGVEVVPALVVEVLSPSSRTIDRVKKPRRYLEFGVPAYWVVDPLEGGIRMWSAETGPESPNRETAVASWLSAGATAPLEIDVAKLIAPL